MNAFSLVAAQLLECNRFTYDPGDEDAKGLKAVKRRAKWRRHMCAIAARLEVARRRLRAVVKTGRHLPQAVEWTGA